MKIALLGASFFLFSTWADGQTCVAPSRATSDSTRYGGNELVSVVEETAVSRVRGKVHIPDGSPAEHALVEIYDNSDRMEKRQNKLTREPERIIACGAGENGEFEIRGLRKNYYKLRVSFGSGFNVTDVFIFVDPRRGSRKRLKVTISLGT